MTTTLYLKDEIHCQDSTEIKGTLSELVMLRCYLFHRIKYNLFLQQEFNTNKDTKIRSPSNSMKLIFFSIQNRTITLPCNPEEIIFLSQ